MDRQKRGWLAGNAAVLVAALALCACGTTEAEQAHDELHRWREQAPASYVYVSNSYELRPDSLFFDDNGYDFGSFRVVVENGKAVSVSEALSGQPLSNDVTTIDGLLKRVIFYMEDAGYRPEDYEASYDEHWGYVKHFSAGVDDFTNLDISCFTPSTGDDACPFSQVAREDCATEPVPAEPVTFADYSNMEAEGRCGSWQNLAKVRGEDLMCCHSIE